MNKISYYLVLFFLGGTLIGWETGNPEEVGYRAVCKKAAEDELYFAQFKTDLAYRPILEHVSKQQGQEYLDIIRQQSPEFLEIIEAFRKNDLYGSPLREHFEGVGAFSPTTLRYMKVASDLNLAYGSSLNQKSIVEIGAGYGGQCLILSAIYQFKNYTIVDLPEALALTKKYLEKHNIHNVTYKSMDDSISERDFDLVISNFAYSELSARMRKKYMDEILGCSKRGYITGFKPTIVEYMDDYNIQYETHPENPCTHPTNALVVWDRCKN